MLNITSNSIVVLHKYCGAFFGDRNKFQNKFSDVYRVDLEKLLLQLK